MKKLILIMGFVMVLLVSNVFAALTDGLVYGHSFDIDARDDVGSNDGTLNGDAKIDIGIVGNGLHLDGVDDRVNKADNFINSTDNFTFSVCFIPNATDSDRIILSETRSTGGTFSYEVLSDHGAQTGNIAWDWFGTGSTVTLNDAFNNSVNHFIGYRNGTQLWGILNNNHSGAQPITITGTSGSVDRKGIGGFGAGATNFQGIIDEFWAWDRVLDGEEQDMLYNDGNCLNPTGNMPPVITLNQPANNSIQTSPLDFIFTPSDMDGGTLNCTLSNETTIYDTGTFSEGIESTLTFSESANNERIINFNITCTDGTDIDTELLTITIDEQNPTITTAITNTTPQVSNEIMINGNCTDTNGISLLAVANNESGTLTNITTLPLMNVSTIEFLFNHTVVLGEIITVYTCEDAFGNSIQASETYISNPFQPEPVISETLDSFPFNRFLNFIVTVIMVVFLTVVLITLFKTSKGFR